MSGKFQDGSNLAGTESASITFFWRVWIYLKN